MIKVESDDSLLQLWFQVVHKSVHGLYTEVYTQTRHLLSSILLDDKQIWCWQSMLASFYLASKVDWSMVTA